MKVLKQEQFLPISLDEAWNFFTTPKNLNRITPEKMDFRITSELSEKMYEGLIISYRIKPMLNIAVDWVTEIMHIEEKRYFIDEQRKGPYKIWHHEHHFESVEDGVLMRDLLYYEVGKSVFGWIASKLFIHKKVKEIFEFRKEILGDFFDNFQQKKSNPQPKKSENAQKTRT